MVCAENGRRLIVNADDFGRSQSINQAVVRAHREGILTTASLMVNEPGFAEAVALARETPQLGVGLHLTLLCGHAALPPEKIPGLVDAERRFSDCPVTVGLRYFARRGLRPQLEAEIRAQFEKFYATGLPLDHVNGHLHLHLHPVVFKILMTHGYPRQALLIAVVYRPDDKEGHAVLMVKTDAGDLVLDNRRDMILQWNDTGYEFLKRQSQENQNRWVRLGNPVSAPPAVSAQSP